MSTIKVAVDTYRRTHPRHVRFIVEVDVLTSFYEVMRELQSQSEHFCNLSLEEQEQFTAHEYIRRYLLEAKIGDVVLGSINNDTA